MPIRTRLGEGKGDAVRKKPIDLFQPFVTLGSIDVWYNYAGAVWQMAYAVDVDGTRYRSLASIMSGVEGNVDDTFPIDYRYRIASIPTISAIDVRNGHADLSSLKGKVVIMGPTAPTIGDIFTLPGRGRYGGVYNHIYAAETLIHGRPVELGWLPATMAALLIAIAAYKQQRIRQQLTVTALGIVALLGVPMLLEPHHVFVDVVTGIFVLTAAASTMGWRRLRASGFINSVSGLPNINALKARPQHQSQALIVGRIFNYPQLAATLNATEERLLVDQIASRLSVGSSDTVIYHGDEGVFAWMADPGIAVGHHVEALHALFRSPAKIGAVVYDLAISFGVEIGSGRTVANRLGSALVAADEAAAEGLKWKYYDPERFKDENWRLSLLAQLDQAIDRGEIWVAYQPQVDLASGEIRGAEALARWTHPEKGPISPHEFISAAEQHGRIDRLTLFMLDQAIGAAARLNRDGRQFQMSVNMSARTLARRTLIEEIRSLLAQHRLDPTRLTLELTETAAMANDGSDLDALLRLRELGTQISIDDYGTGLSTLEYLKKIPAGEIKIDQSFIKSMSDNRSDMVMVQSTIALAHSLGRTVVAEGVESPETLAALKEMECDAVQGFFIGRPVSYEGLIRQLKQIRRHRAA